VKCLFVSQVVIIDGIDDHNYARFVAIYITIFIIITVIMEISLRISVSVVDQPQSECPDEQAYCHSGQSRDCVDRLTS